MNPNGYSIEEAEDAQQTLDDERRESCSLAASCYTTELAKRYHDRSNQFLEAAVASADKEAVWTYALIAGLYLCVAKEIDAAASSVV